jgi:hypothetical protein
LIALESPELCSTLAAIKELISRRHKELITIKTLKKGEEQRSREFLCGCNGGEFVYCPAAKKELQWCFLDGLQPVNRASP